MNTRHSFGVANTSLNALASFLRETNTNLNPTLAAAAAIEDWIANAREQGRHAVAGKVRGYQWKCLFLPDLTELRMCYGGQSFYAAVTGDAIMYEGRSVSPRQLTLAIAGQGRNAWRDLWIRFPGDASWKCADALRRALLQAPLPVPTPAAPSADALSATAASLAGALKTALALVEQAKAQALVQPDRRRCQSRRADDLQACDCRFH
ncbi:MAG: hypothetical protein V4857_26415 [Pseudomonadota bacterium]